MFRDVSRMTIVMVLLGLLAAQGALAANLERIATSTRWEGTVELQGPVQVDKGARLMIAPGTVVRAQLPGSKLLVLGTLVVNGNPKAPVRFETVKGWAQGPLTK